MKLAVPNAAFTWAKVRELLRRAAQVRRSVSSDTQSYGDESIANNNDCLLIWRISTAHEIIGGNGEARYTALDFNYNPLITYHHLGRRTCKLPLSLLGRLKR
jgi:hypothetical protein